MVGSQLLLLVMNVWFLRGFSTSVGQYIGSGGALSNGKGSVFLWLFCAIAFLKTAQKFDSYPNRKTATQSSGNPKMIQLTDAFGNIVKTQKRLVDGTVITQSESSYDA